MRIERLRIQNYRRLRLVDLELPDGVTALVGRNGAGKSTLLEAIGWCLYGMDAARTEKELVKRRGAAPSDDVRVHLAFHLGPHHYEVTRELVGKSGAHVATVLVDGKVVVPAGAQSAKESVAYVARALHMDARGFFTSLVARQRELAALTDAKPAERKRILIGLLRLDAVDEAIQEARTARRDLGQRLAGLQAARVDVATLTKTLADVRAGIEADGLRVAAAEARVVELAASAEAARVRRDAGRKLADEHRAALVAIELARQRVQHAAAQRARIEQELAAARAAAVEASALAPRLALLAAARARCDEIKLLRQKAAEAERVRLELRRTQAEAATAQAEGAALEAQLAGASAVRSQLDRYLAQFPVLEASVQQAQQTLAEAHAAVRGHEVQLQESNARLESVRRLGADTPCPTCTRPLGDHRDQLVATLLEESQTHLKRLHDARGAVHMAHGALAAKQAEHKSLADRGAELRMKAVALERVESRLAAHRQRAADALARAARLSEQVAALALVPYDPLADERARLDLEALEKDRDRHARLAHAADREPALVPQLAEATTLNATAREAEAAGVRARDALGFDAAAHEALERASSQLEGQLTEARVQRERIAGESARKLDEEKRLVTEVARQEDLERQAAALQADARLLERLCGDPDGLLVRFKDHLIGRIRPMLSAHAGRLFRDMTEGRYADLEVADDYDLRVHDEGEAFGLARFSGGESDLANLCLRLAVSHVVAERSGAEGFQFLALDEIFGSQDEIRKGNVLRALKALSGRFRQILLVTHVDDVKDAVEHVIRVEAMEDGTSSVTVDG